ncbi:MAG TPA: hypothetical protein VF179_13820 [Thermoanaerobaculia bacterium]|nr:hypothetical protein [Thermoanaerobaculia bacterium]
MIVPSGFTLSAPGSPGRNDLTSSSIDNLLRVASFGWLNELAGCNDFRGTFGIVKT